MSGRFFTLRDRVLGVRWRRLIHEQPPDHHVTGVFVDKLPEQIVGELAGTSYLIR